MRWRRLWPRQRIGVRLSPESRFNDLSDSDPAIHFAFFAAELSRACLAYLLVLEGDLMTRSSALDYRGLRCCFDGIYIANNGYDSYRAMTAVRNGDADMVAFGVAILAAPDLVIRLARNWLLNPPDPDTFYVGGDRGYIDSPEYAPAETVPS